MKTGELIHSQYTGQPDYWYLDGDQTHEHIVRDEDDATQFAIVDGRGHLLIDRIETLEQAEILLRAGPVYERQYQDRPSVPSGR